MRLRSATMLTQQQQTGVLETIEPPSWKPPRDPNWTILRKLCLNHGKIHHQGNLTVKSSAPDPLLCGSRSSRARAVAAPKRQSVGCDRRRVRAQGPSRPRPFAPKARWSSVSRPAARCREQTRRRPTECECEFYPSDSDWHASVPCEGYLVKGTISRLDVPEKVMSGLSASAAESESDHSRHFERVVTTSAPPQ
jgi:hypothetical protein